MTTSRDASRRLAAAVVCAALTGGCAWMERSSVSSAPPNAAGGAGSYGPSLSQSGRYVAFTSDASDLVDGDTNEASDVFVRDHVTGSTERISLGPGGSQIPAASSGASISDDGRYVAFTTAAPLTGEDADTVADVYVRDRSTGTTVLVSIGPGGAPTPLGIVSSSLSGDGRHLAFMSVTGVPAGGPAAGPYGPIVRHLDLTTSTAVRVPAGFALPGSSVVPVDLEVSDEGSRVAYVAVSFGTGTGLAAVAAGTTGAHLETIATWFANPDSIVPYAVAVSGDGTRWAFVDNRGALPGDDVLTVGTLGTATRDSITTRFTRDLGLSDDGTVVGWLEADGGQHLLVRDLAVGETKVVSADAAAREQVAATSGALSGDGKWVAFTTAGLAPGESRGFTQVYTRSVSAPSPSPA